MYSIEKRTRKWFDMAADGMDFEDYFVVLDPVGTVVAEADDEAAARRIMLIHEAFEKGVSK